MESENSDETGGVSEDGRENMEISDGKKQTCILAGEGKEVYHRASDSVADNKEQKRSSHPKEGENLFCSIYKSYEKIFLTSSSQIKK
jgi:hypothetical protein